MVIEVFIRCTQMNLKKNNEFKFIAAHIKRNFDIKIQQATQYAYKSNDEARSCDHCHLVTAVNIGYSECVLVALVIQMQSYCVVLYCHL